MKLTDEQLKALKGDVDKAKKFKELGFEVPDEYLKKSGASNTDPGGQNNDSGGQNTGSSGTDQKDAEIAKLRKEAAKYRTERNDLKKSQEDAEKKSLEKQGEFQKLYEAEKAKIIEFEKNNVDLVAKVKVFEDAEETKRQELLKKLPNDDLRGTFKDATSDMIAAIVAQSADSSGTSAGAITGVDGKKITDINLMSQEQQQEFQQQNPEAFNKAVQESINKQIGVTK